MNISSAVAKTMTFKLSASEIGRRIKARREHLKQSQSIVGRACGISQNGVMRIEQGRTENSRFVPAIWNYLGMDLTELSDIYAPQQRDLDALPPTDLVVTRKISVRLIQTIAYEEVELPDAGSGLGIMITWTMRNGATISGVMDCSMIPQAVREFAAVARRLDIDPEKYVQARE